MDYEKVRVYGVTLEDIKELLKREGFQHTPLQIWKPGQVFGLVKKVKDPWEMHVRGFEDGHLEAEFEVSRDYLEHLDDRHRRSAARELSLVLSEHGIPHTIESNSSNIKLNLEVPKTLTPWKLLLTFGFILFTLYLLGKREGK
ncbi:MAG: hypothetical protein J7K33_03475 [Candidatus Marinimicrobia bacterium]|nr:hypothetical protein [Candidatus Neomarinimicrobiota bacterium]